MSRMESHPALADLFEELAGRVQAGESVDLEAIAREHPELAEPLRGVMPAIEALVALGRTAAQGAIDPVLADSDPGLTASVLGDFHILREIGRGGMGLVYEAGQISLNRRVALKVLPFAAALDPRQLQRFRVEAQAAALLHHAHIVPVYSVGCERGVHYYAMQFIEGRTLADLIGELRQLQRPGAAGPPRAGTGPSVPGEEVASGSQTATQCGSVADQPLALDPTSPGSHEEPALRPSAVPSSSSARGRAFYKTMADLGLQAAEALEHAHQLGVVHRDIKPANMLVDARGHLWITDFGLARLHHDPNLSRTGDLLGTVRYMSPEQALGRPAAVDHRTDIYSLGVTLYELLTLRPAFDRQERHEVLRQILQDEPVPPRKVDRAIPEDLATIVLKAMAKAPGERYASAQELADDLRRYLEVRPIRARRPTLVQRVAKWSRRHQPIVASAAAALVLAVIGLAVSNVRIRGEERAKEFALRQKDEALAQREAALAQAQASARRATIEARNAGEISDLLQEMLASANPDRAKGVGYTVRELLDDFSGRLDGRLAQEPEVEATIRRAIGVAYRRLGLPDRARPHLETALDLRRRNFGATHERVAESLLDFAWNLASAGDHAEAELHVREALAIYRKRDVQAKPLIAALWALVWLDVYQGRHAEAEEAGREALALAGAEPGAECPEIASLLHTLADSNNDRRRYTEAERLAREAVALHSRLNGEQHPETGWGWNALALALLGQGRYAEAATAYREALAIFRKQYDDRHKSMAQASRGLAAALEALGDESGLETLLRQALADLYRPVEQDPDDPEARLRRGLALAEWDQWGRAAADCELALRHQDRLDPRSIESQESNARPESRGVDCPV